MYLIGLIFMLICQFIYLLFNSEVLHGKYCGHYCDIEVRFSHTQIRMATCINLINLRKMQMSFNSVFMLFCSNAHTHIYVYAHTNRLFKVYLLVGNHVQ